MIPSAVSYAKSWVPGIGSNPFTCSYTVCAWLVRNCQLEHLKLLPLYALTSIAVYDLLRALLCLSLVKTTVNLFKCFCMMVLWLKFDSERVRNREFKFHMVELNKVTVELQQEADKFEKQNLIHQEHGETFKRENEKLSQENEKLKDTHNEIRSYFDDFKVFLSGAGKGVKRHEQRDRDHN